MNKLCARRGQNSVGSKGFSLFQSAETGSEVRPDYYSEGITGYFRGVKRPGREATCVISCRNMLVADPVVTTVPDFRRLVETTKLQGGCSFTLRHQKETAFWEQGVLAEL